MKSTGNQELLKEECPIDDALSEETEHKLQSINSDNGEGEKAAPSAQLERTTTLEHLAQKTDTDPSWRRVDYLEKARINGENDDELEIKQVMFYCYIFFIRLYLSLFLGTNSS